MDRLPNMAAIRIASLIEAQARTTDPRQYDRQGTMAAAPRHSVKMLESL
ncbi:hypothetical protein [Mesorhizobium sp. ES1-4]|nr:hypothetical protein [Mesorhizobium sp. ES1-4]MBZ9796248.1 hypothetical protein [Mesorhizobium sp. ES1-4]